MLFYMLNAIVGIIVGFTAGVILSSDQSCLYFFVISMFSLTMYCIVYSYVALFVLLLFMTSTTLIMGYNLNRMVEENSSDENTNK